MDKIEMAAFLAHVNKETGSMSEWLEAVNGNETKRYGQGTIMCDPNSEYKCVPNTWYNGRGPLQLTWNFNYGKFSEFWHGDRHVFLKDPDIIVKNPTIGWGSAFWFWMQQATFDVWSHTMGDCVCPFPHEKFMNDAITRSKGFGLSIAIINGQIECSPYNGEDQRKSMPLARLRYFLFNLFVLKVPLPESLVIDKDKFYEHDFMRIPDYMTKGCPMISIDSQAANRACAAKCKGMIMRLGHHQDEPVCKEEWSEGKEIKGCPECSGTHMSRAQLYGAVKCGYNLNDPNKFQFDLPWPAVGSLEALSYQPEGYAYCELMTGTYNGTEFFYPRTFATDCMIHDGMCIYAKDGKTRLGKYVRMIRHESKPLNIGVEIESCDTPDKKWYCCFDNHHTWLMKYSKHGYAELTLWYPEPLFRWQCDSCAPECDDGPCKAPEQFPCPTGSCDQFSPFWPDGSWKNNKEIWPGSIL